MNERIRELAEQAGITTNLDTDYFEKDTNKWVDYFSEQLVKLVVQECSKVIETWKKEPFPFDEDLAVQLIHEHFGFEVPPKHIKVIKI